MAVEQSSIQRIAHNSLMLNLRMIISVVVGIYTSRIVLQTLGIVDYGILGVVGGIVTMFIFINKSLSSATTRFITIEQGTGSYSNQKAVFNGAIQSHFIIALCVFVCAQTLGFSIFKYLDIPDNRQNESFWVYQISLLSAIVSIIQTPFTATIIAHEAMDVYARFEIINVSLKLLAVWLLQFLFFDHLITYSVLILTVSLLMLILHYMYCHYKFPEVQISLSSQTHFTRLLLKFTGWTLFSEGSASVRQQGINIIFNRFWGVVINASVSVALMVQGFFWTFGHNIIAAFQPQIVKQYAAGNIMGMEKMMCRAFQFTVLSALIITIPSLFCMKHLLSFWLGNVPPFAVLLCQLLIFDNLVGLVNHIVSIGIIAVGDIRSFCVVNGILKLLCLPVSFLVLNFFASPGVPFFVCISMLMVILCVNIIMLKHRIPDLHIRAFFRSLFGPIAVGLVATLFVVPFHLYLDNDWLHMIVVTLLFSVILSVGSYFLILERSTRFWINKKVVCFLK